ncbi:hypothetical protein EU803_02250 [Loktanella sp. IMCC34160]|uniref:hypothetical protein n=1 Tax=Loktanella sp. IMCC34160 TaxID=2510646 RepID=UPI00101D47BA|nr:hypothetical protein [Loktanella sp. IMCC34160]RYG92950.1 hypothetical protein EU803_02250 [Loktanella sp. IMCC34160]
MIRWGLVFWAAFAALPAQADVLRADYAELAGRLAGRLDFEDFVRKPEPGMSVDSLIEAEGITLGEHVVGRPPQTVPGPGPGQFDAFFNLMGLPPDLPIAPGVPGRNMAVSLHDGLGSNALYPLGPVGFPDVGALGEGTIAVRFDSDQTEFGFRLHADYDDPLGSRPAPGRAFLMIFGRDGAPIGFDVIRLRHGPMDLAWRIDGGPGAAGFTLAPDDPPGYALDDFIFALVAPAS